MFKLMRLNHLIALVIGCNATKLTCTSPVELSGNVALRFSILECAQVHASHGCLLSFKMIL